MAPFALDLVETYRDTALGAEPSQPEQQLVSGHDASDMAILLGRPAPSAVSKYSTGSSNRG